VTMRHQEIDSTENSALDHSIVTAATASHSR
jgi:hypothetical protein